MTQKEQRHLLALTAQNPPWFRLTCLGQIAHRFVEGIGHPRRRQFAGAVQPGQAHGITPVGLNPLSRPLGIDEGATTARSCPRS